MPSIGRNLPVKCTKCEKMVVKQQMARHKKSCDSETLKCPKYPHFYTKRTEYLNYHLAKHHAPQEKKLSTVCTICLEEFPSFYSLHSIRDGNTEHRQSWNQIQRKLEKSTRSGRIGYEQRTVTAGT